jgi:hypothetical protein
LAGTGGGRAGQGQRLSAVLFRSVNQTTHKTYQGGQIEALYREIFALQTGAGWQDEPDFVTWYGTAGWSHHRPRDVSGIVDVPALSIGGKTAHFVLLEKVERIRQEMQDGRWDDRLPEHLITVMADGEVMEGHHRLTAASEVDWAKVPNRPQFTALFRSDLIPD